MKNVDKKLLHKYLNNQCTPVEANQVLLYLNTPEGQQHLTQLLKTDWDGLEGRENPWAGSALDSDKLFTRIQLAKAADQSLAIEQPVLPNERQLIRIWPRVAAACTIVFMIAFALWWLVKPANVMHQTAYGQTQRITLPDQSIVILNGNSTLEFKANWNAGTDREVWLKGEAYFSVTHTTTHQRFVVHTSDQLNVEVLGTQFNVYKRKEKTKVVLNSGKVRLNITKEANPATHLEMRPGDLVEVDNASKSYVKKVVNPEVYSSWRGSKLVFDKTSLREIVEMLEDTYGLTVEVSEPGLLNQRFSGTIPNTNVNVLLDGMAGLFALKITRDENHIRLQSEF